MRQALPLDHMRFGLLSLGDRQYQSFCQFGRSLHQWLAQQGAQSLFAPIEVDKTDPDALQRWRSALSQLANGAAIEAPTEPQLQGWRLTGRRQLNPGSVGAPTWLVELEPPAGAIWQAGDIAVVQPGNEGTERREYSIASIPEDGSLQLVVRQVTRTDGTAGSGSGWLTAGAPIGSEVMLYIRENPSFHAPGDSRPVILIGNGTGIAGLRSILKSRVHRGEQHNWLLFGERNAAHDFYLRDEIEAWRAAGLLPRLSLAFSRDQVTRLYVQDRLREEAAALRQWVDDGAAIYVCGSAEGMAQEVDRVLEETLGRERLDELAAAGSYRRDVY
ncbi:MAG: flavodoxin domain-containing protein [Steroidobacteraceae bacterium]